MHARLPLLLLFLFGCDTETPSSAVVDNALAHATVYKVWWSTTLFAAPVAPGRESEAERTVPGADYAYALLAPDWDPASGSPPARLVAARSNDKLAVARGDTLHVVVSDASFVGDCTTGKPLSQDDVDFVTQRIFPGDFAGATYDAKTCTTTSADAGSTD